MQVINIRVKQLTVLMQGLLTSIESYRKEYADIHYKGLTYKALLRKTNKLAKDINKAYIQGEQLNNEYKELTGDSYDWRFLNPKLYKVS